MRHKTDFIDNKHTFTKDGSSTLFSARFAEHYHSMNGAFTESRHIFIRQGLAPMIKKKKHVKVLEMGLGTGLNALMTSLVGKEIQIDYVGIEAYPLDDAELCSLNYAKKIKSPDAKEFFQLIHKARWGEWSKIGQNFRLWKYKGRLQDFDFPDTFDVIYYDAFSAEVQPELWTEDIFKKIARYCRPGAVLVTYSSRGSVRRALQAAGFTVEKLEGPEGKRHMVKAIF